MASLSTLERSMSHPIHPVYHTVDTTPNAKQTAISLSLCLRELIKKMNKKKCLSQGIVVVPLSVVGCKRDVLALWLVSLICQEAKESSSPSAVRVVFVFWKLESKHLFGVATQRILNVEETFWRLSSLSLDPFDISATILTPSHRAVHNYTTIGVNVCVISH